MVDPAQQLEPGEGRRPRRKLLWSLTLLLVGALVATLFASRLGGQAAARSVLLNRAAPALQGPTLDDGPFDLRSLRGKLVLVNVWASWCIPCRAEQPLLVDTYRRLSPQGLAIAGINVRDRPADALAFLRAYGNAPWPSVRDPDGVRAVQWGTFALPETYLVDRRGIIVAKAVGQLDAGWVTANVLPRLGAA